MNTINCWGFYPKVKNQIIIYLRNRFDVISFKNTSFLPRGLGRSYGDSCLNEDGALLGTSNLDNLISFDKYTGILKCESGVTFDDILQLIVPAGWFLPVTPGTKFITVGGAIANDVHGKNHHSAGNFGHHVLSFEILRSTGERLICSPSRNTDLFYATIGGLGLTGIITWAEFQLKKVSSAWITQEQIQFKNVDDFFRLSEESENNFEYTVAWVDCVNSDNSIQGIFIRGNHADTQGETYKVHPLRTIKIIPFFMPSFMLNKYTVKLFNFFYYRKNLCEHKKNTVHYDQFFYPLDSIHHWNRIYGKRGFLQYQFVVPYKTDNGKALKDIFRLLQDSQMGSFLAVIKTFGAKKSVGCLSFPQEGVTLALDFANYGEKLLHVLEECDQIVRNAGGRIYPAKDARMSKETFASGYKNISEFKIYIDPQISSSFWRRVK